MHATNPVLRRSLAWPVSRQVLYSIRPQAGLVKQRRYNLFYRCLVVLWLNDTI